MKQAVTRKQVEKLVGKVIFATRKDGSRVSGKLIRISGNRLILQPNRKKKVNTKAIIPLVLFDLLAIGTAPYVGAYGGYGPGYGGPGYGGPGYGPQYGPYTDGGYPGVGYPFYPNFF
ncbi:hypothetical protein NS115_17925 [Paenibacillus jamilae]|uniref:50S ribosomal protein L33 n=2 Tax=Paenibacillus TaxID=44249 RepID=E3EEJ8_PAEPS|nr:MULTISPECIES: hypothetical protein [Paenibacillus]MCV9949056.1 hypothetical protein [Paenibacillus sp. BT-177]ADO55449.1 hypothetical protein PPSC2_07060 [Paenibacillus polymyxa SC2]AUO05169.1 hypothetical protein C0638_00605 [Paenibacillus sp. lzh-N1]KTS80944.1 hypothetical protein NS115_17925 [Paenibacillus jamilae]UNL96022.1 hypothetical protein CPY53_21840 [Paenibacillus polymyxa]